MGEFADKIVVDDASANDQEVNILLLPQEAGTQPRLRASSSLFRL